MARCAGHAQHAAPCTIDTAGESAGEQTGLVGAALVAARGLWRGILQAPLAAAPAPADCSAKSATRQRARRIRQGNVLARLVGRRYRLAERYRLSRKPLWSSSRTQVASMS